MAMDTDRPAAPPPRDDAPAGSEQRRTASQAAPRDRRHAGRAILRPEAGTGSRHPQTPRWPAAGTATPLRTTAKQRGGVTGKGFLPGRSGNAGDRPGGDGLMRKRLLASFHQNEAAAMAAMARVGQSALRAGHVETAGQARGRAHQGRGQGRSPSDPVYPGDDRRGPPPGSRRLPRRGGETDYRAGCERPWRVGGGATMNGRSRGPD